MLSKFFSKHKGLISWTFGGLFYAYCNLIIVMPSVVKFSLSKQIHTSTALISNQQFGMLTSSLLIAYTIMQIPYGILLDRFSIRKILALSSFLCGASTIGFGYIHSYNYALISRMVTGLGAASAALCSFKLASNWFDERKYATLTGLLLTLGGVGAILANEPFHRFATFLGDRSAIIIVGFMGIGLALLMLSCVRDGPLEMKNENQPSITLTRLLDILKKKETYIVSIFGMLLFTPYGILKDTWGSTFVNQAFPANAHSDSINSLLVFGFIIGAPLFGWYSDRIQKRKPVLLLSCVGAIICLSSILLPSINQSLFIFSVIYFSIGFFISGFLPSFSVMKEINPIIMVATSMGIMNTINNIGEMSLTPFIGGIMDKLDDGSTLVSAFSSTQHAFIILPIILSVALVLYFFIPETNATQACNRSKLSDQA